MQLPPVVTATHFPRLLANIVGFMTSTPLPAVPGFIAYTPDSRRDEDTEDLSARPLRCDDPPIARDIAADNIQHDFNPDLCSRLYTICKIAPIESAPPCSSDIPPTSTTPTLRCEYFSTGADQPAPVCNIDSAYYALDHITILENVPNLIRGTVRTDSTSFTMRVCFCSSPFAGMHCSYIHFLVALLDDAEFLHDAALFACTHYLGRSCSIVHVYLTTVRLIAYV